MTDDRLILREPRNTDLQRINEIHNQRGVAEMTLQIPFTQSSERQRFLEPSDYHRAIVAEIDGVPVGMLGLSLYRMRRSHVGAIGMSVDEAYQGRGIGSALVAAAVDLADNWYNLHRLELQVYVDNHIAIQLYEKHGFVIEGTHRDYAYRAGRYVDAHTMARLRPSDVGAGQPQLSDV